METDRGCELGQTGVIAHDRTDPDSGIPTRSPAVEALYECDVSAFELQGDAPIEPGTLGPGEEILIENAGATRRRDFTAGRACAHAALSLVGHVDFAVLSEPSRAPIWPTGVAGSISHTANLAVAVATLVPDSAVLGIGIDAEVVGRVDASIETMILGDSERAMLDDAGEDQRSVSATAIFAAKEAFYKAQWPITGSWVGFTDVRARCFDSVVQLTPGSGLGALGLVRWPVQVRYVERAATILAGCTVAGS